MKAVLRSFCSSNQPNTSTAVKPDHPEVQRLLNSLAGLDLDRVMAKRREPLVVPHYQLMTLEQLKQVSVLGVCVLLVDLIIGRFKKKPKLVQGKCCNLLLFCQNEHLVEK